MSLDPHWYSTIFGILTLGGQGLSTLAFTIIVLAGAVEVRADVGRWPTPRTFHDLGKLMFAFMLLWAYFNVSQLHHHLVGEPARGDSVLPRAPARAVGADQHRCCCSASSSLPFLLLLSRDLKRNPHAVRCVALFILVMRVVDITWTIGPVFRHEGSSAVAGSTSPRCSAWARCGWSLFWRNLAGRPLVPAHDPYFKEAVAHGGH